MPSNRREPQKHDRVPYAQATMKSWLQDLGSWFDPNAVDFDVSEDGALHFTLETAAHKYFFSARVPEGRGTDQGYLGCVATHKKSKRGNDLPDGPFSRETWQEILFAIVGYECVDFQKEKVR